MQWAYATGDGGKNAVCRPQQSEGLIHYGVTSLSDCKVLCENEAGCWGVEFSHAAAHCEMWDIPITGIENFPGSVCLQRTASSPAAVQVSGAGSSSQPRWTPVDGGVGRSCSGDDAEDSKESYFILREGVEYITDCQAQCEDIGSPSTCYAIEHNEAMSRCELWTRPVSATASMDGYSCMKYNPASNGRRLAP